MSDGKEINFEITMGIDKAFETIKDTETMRAADKTTSLVFRTVNAMLSPLEIWILNSEYNVEKTKLLLSEKLKNVGAEHIVSPLPYVAVPALQAISYCFDNDELREMYAELLKTAMVDETYKDVHPTYVEIIRQMSPFDAVVFRKLIEKLIIPCIQVTYRNKASGATYPIADIIAFDDLVSYPIVPTQIALENLERLRLIEIDKRSIYRDETPYNRLTQCMKKYVEQFVEDNKSHLMPDEYEVHYNKFVIKIRGFGQYFARACMGTDFSHIK